jgi:hypothetical protein
LLMGFPLYVRVMYAKPITNLHSSLLCPEPSEPGGDNFSRSPPSSTGIGHAACAP